MIIPIRCVSCNTVIAGKWETYQKFVQKYRKEMKQGDDMVYLTATTTKTAEGKALDEVGLKKMCCRRHFLTHVDMIPYKPVLSAGNHATSSRGVTVTPN